jgi:CheY-like chemotaxis protein
VISTKGDNSDPDPWAVTEDVYQGTLRLRVPAVGWPLVFITSPKGILFVSIGTLITLLYFPAMMMFHMTVLRRPKEQGAAAPIPSGLALRAGAPMATSASVAASEGGTAGSLADAVGKLSAEQQQIRGALLHLNESVAVYASNISSQTDLVRDLTAITQMLKGALSNEPGQVAQAGSRAVLLGVMIVDDQEPFRKRARSVLEIEGDFKVLAEAGDGAEALELMEEVKPDLVLMDIQMPQMNGFEATRRIQEKYPGTKIAIISMDNDHEYERMAEEVGASGFIAKKDLTAARVRNALRDRPAASGG